MRPENVYVVQRRSCELFLLLHECFIVKVSSFSIPRIGECEANTPSFKKYRLRKSVGLILAVRLVDAFDARHPEGSYWIFLMDKVLDFVGEIYEASYNPEHWHTVIQRLCIDILGARSGALFLHDYASTTRSMIGCFGIPKVAELSYRFGMSKYDYTFQAQSREEPGHAREIINAAEFKASHPIYYRLILKPNNIGYIAGMNVYNDDEWHVGIGVHRAFGTEPFSRDDMKMLEILYPHFKRAIRIQKEFHTLRVQRQSLQAALSRMMLGVVIVQPNGNVAYTNPVADSLLANHSGLRRVNGKLRAYYGDENDRLSAMISQLAGADPKNITTRNLAIGLNHPDRDNSLTVMVAPLGDAEFGQESGEINGAVALYLSDSASGHNIPAEALSSLYGLSPAEANVAISLANGLSVNHIAAQNSVSLETVRSQLKAIFSKLGVSKQQDVIRILLGSAAQIRQVGDVS